MRWITHLATRYLERRGYIVVKNRIPMLLVSGNALAIATTEDGMYYDVSFPWPPVIVALNGSYVTKHVLPDGIFAATNKPTTKPEITHG